MTKHYSHAAGSAEHASDRSFLGSNFAKTSEFDVQFKGRALDSAKARRYHQN